METIKIKGVEHEVLFTSRAIAMIEKQLKKSINDLGIRTFEDGKLTGVVYTIEELSVALKHGLHKVQPAISEDEVWDIIDENKGCAVSVFTSLMNAYSAVYTMAEAGNSEAPTS